MNILCFLRGGEGRSKRVSIVLKTAKYSKGAFQSGDVMSGPCLPTVHLQPRNDIHSEEFNCIHFHPKNVRLRNTRLPGIASLGFSN